MKKSFGKYRCRFKFTLVELLVVIVIITVLASLMLPALKAAKDLSKEISCKNNFRQLGLATYQYVNDNNGYLSPGQFWVRELCPYIGVNNVANATYVKETVSKRMQSFICPAETSPDRSPAWEEPSYNGEPKSTSYGVTSRAKNPTGNLGPEGAWEIAYYITGSTRMPNGKNLTKVLDSSVLLIEKYQNNLHGSGVVLPHGLSTAASTNLSFGDKSQLKYAAAYRHNTKGVFMFKDGHVNSYKFGLQRFNDDWQPTK